MTILPKSKNNRSNIVKKVPVLTVLYDKIVIWKQIIFQIDPTKIYNLSHTDSVAQGPGTYSTYAGICQ